MKRLLHILLVLFFAVGLVACQDLNLDNLLTDDHENNVENNDSNAIGEDSEFAYISETRDNVDGKIESGKGGFMWKVDNGDTTAYLLGTIHLATKDIYPFNDLIEDAYESADVVVPEIDMNEVNILSELGSTLKNGVYIDGSTAEDNLSPEVYAKLEETLDEHGLPMNIMKFFKPWMLNMTVTQLLVMEHDLIHGIDMYFLNRADEDGKEVIALETSEEQYDILASPSPEFQEKELERTLDTLDEFEDTMKDSLSLYLDGQVEELMDYLFPSDEEIDEEYAEYLKKLLDDRNVKMADKIEDLLEDGSGRTYFVIVGAAHYVKDPHILTMLDEKGYEIEHVY